MNKPNTKTRDVAGILHFLSTQQMAEEVVRLDRQIEGMQHPQASEPAQAAFDRLPMCGVKADGTCDQCAGSCMWFGKASEPAPSTAGEQGERAEVAALLKTTSGCTAHDQEVIYRAAALLEAHPKLEPLTDDDLWKFWCTRPEVPEGEDCSMEAQFVSTVRAILAAAHKIGGRG